MADKPRPIDRLSQQQKTSPSGATDKTIEREEKFDEEGGDQPQAPSQQAVDAELEKALSESPDSGAPGTGNTGRLPERSEFRPEQKRKPK